MEEPKGSAQKALNKGGRAEIDLLRDEVVAILENLKLAEQIAKAILSKIKRIQRNG